MGRIARHLADLTPEWFTEALGAGRVREVTLEPIGQGVMAQCLRASLTWDGTGPDSVVVKLASADPGSLAMATALRMYEVEVGFYRDLAPRLADLRVPKVYLAEHDRDAFTIVAEDLRDHRPGDALTAMTPAELSTAVRELVHLQAPLWDSPELPALGWLSDPQRVHGFFDVLAMSAEPFLTRFADHLEPDHVRLFEAAVPNAGAWARSWRSPLVLQHGDYRADNFLWSPAGELAVIDFQTVRPAPPGLDLAYLLASAVPVDDRRRLERDLVAAHREGLREQGVDYADGWRDYCEGALYGVVLFAGGAGQVESTPRGDQMIAAGAARFAQMAIDLDSLHVAGLA